MNFIDVCFRSNAIGTIDNYKCETILYGINDNLEKINIVTWIEINDDKKEICNPNITSDELMQIKELLKDKRNVNSYNKVKVKKWKK